MTSMWPLPAPTARENRSVNGDEVADCPATSISFIAIPSTNELFVPVVNAGITDVDVCAARSDTWIVPSRTEVRAEHEKMTAPEESPDVPVVTPDHEIVQSSAVVPVVATRVNTYTLPPDAVPDRFGNPATRLHPEGVETVAVIDRHHVTAKRISPAVVVGQTAVNVVGSATVVGPPIPEPTALIAGLATLGGYRSDRHRL